MARKQIIFVIVEGMSDQEALGAILSHIYDKNSVYIHVMHKDITTKFNSAPNKNVITMIADEVKMYAKLNHFSKSDFKEIIHLVDMDGAFIPNNCIIDDTSAESPLYSVTEIRTTNKSGIEKRNSMKRSNIDILCCRNKIWDIPYSIYYMSCNLDHVLYNKLNSSNSEKEADAFNFAKFYKDNIPDFIDFISKSDFSVVNDYKNSWDFIKRDLHSLERHSNLGLCFIED